MKLLKHIALYVLLTMTVGLQAGETELGETETGETKLGETGKTKLGETKLGETEIGETKLGKTELDETEIYELAKRLLQSHRNNQFLPFVSSSHPNLSVEQAYLVQRYYVEKRLADEKPAGFKAGLTSLAAQKAFKINQAVTGVLFGSGDLSAAKLIKLSQFKRVMLETEIGFEIGKAITEPIANQAELKQYIKAVFPVIELPDLGAAVKPTAVVDIIAANVGAAAFIKGKPVTNFAELDFNALKITLTPDEETVDVVQGANTLGNQWDTVLWLVNSVIAHGWTLEPGQFVITGSVGKITMPEPGNYTANFGKLGQISFLVVL